MWTDADTLCAAVFAPAFAFAPRCNTALWSFAPFRRSGEAGRAQCAKKVKGMQYALLLLLSWMSEKGMPVCRVKSASAVTHGGDAVGMDDRTIPRCRGAVTVLSGTVARARRTALEERIAGWRFEPGSYDVAGN